MLELAYMALLALIAFIPCYVAFVVIREAFQ